MLVSLFYSYIVFNVFCFLLDTICNWSFVMLLCFHSWWQEITSQWGGYNYVLHSPIDWTTSEFSGTWQNRFKFCFKLLKLLKSLTCDIDHIILVIQEIKLTPYIWSWSPFLPTIIYNPLCLYNMINIIFTTLL